MDVNTGVFMVLFVIVFILLDVIYSLRDISYWARSRDFLRLTLSAARTPRSVRSPDPSATAASPSSSCPSSRWFTEFTRPVGAGPRTGWAAFAIIIAVLGLLTAWSVAFSTREERGELRAKAEANGNPAPSRRSRHLGTTSSYWVASATCCTLWPTSPPPVLFYQFKYVLGARTASPSPASSRSSPDWSPRPLPGAQPPHSAPLAVHRRHGAAMIAGYTLFIMSAHEPARRHRRARPLLPSRADHQMAAILSMTDSIEYGQLKTGKRNEAVTSPCARC